MLFLLSVIQLALFKGIVVEVTSGGIIFIISHAVVEGLKVILASTHIGVHFGSCGSCGSGGLLSCRLGSIGLDWIGLDWIGLELTAHL